jgi:hypothetical protein
MLSEAALREALATAYEHLEPGGVFLTFVEMNPATFVQNMTNAWTKSRPEVELTFVENYYDPDPADSTYECTFVYLIREGGKLRIETDHHVGGMFPIETWRKSLKSVGFEVAELEYTTQGQTGQAVPVLLGLKPQD